MEKLQVEMEEKMEFLHREMKKELVRQRSRSALVKVVPARSVKKAD
jgi:hypothetical protein